MPRLSAVQAYDYNFPRRNPERVASHLGDPKAVPLGVRIQTLDDIFGRDRLRLRAQDCAELTTRKDSFTSQSRSPLESVYVLTP